LISLIHLGEVLPAVEGQYALVDIEKATTNPADPNDEPTALMEQEAPMLLPAVCSPPIDPAAEVRPSRLSSGGILIARYAGHTFIPNKANSTSGNRLKRRLRAKDRLLGRRKCCSRPPAATLLRSRRLSLPPLLRAKI